MASIPQKTMKKQHAGVASVFGCVGVAVTIAGLAMLVIGAVRDGEMEWDRAEANVTGLSTTACTYECKCSRACTSGSSLTSCFSTRSCTTGCQGVQATYNMSSSNTDCPTVMLSHRVPAPILTHVSTCESAAQYIVGDALSGYQQRDCYDGRRLFNPPSAFPLGRPHNSRADAGYLIQVGAIVLGCGVAAFLASMATFFYSKPSFEAATLLAKDRARAATHEVSHTHIELDGVGPDPHASHVDRVQCMRDATGT
eukprot:TRINITY_DN30340_c0_g1_i1.p2 TRINITY_DN30340_c0_g1~~TRINITY_DN30340_c0_g1_i1.p2  ORF type:complete len:290 (+),score=50.27 TRINITY_DN30340_c0_g1_i1:109-870(+)